MDTWNELVGIYYRDKTNWDVAFAGVMLMGSWAVGRSLWGAGWIDSLNGTPRRKGRAMRRARRQYVDTIIVDEFVGAIENRVYHEEISRMEATECYRRMKLLFPLRDLFPSPERLKEDIKRRLGRHEPVNLPGSEPKKRRTMFEKVKT